MAVLISAPAAAFAVQLRRDKTSANVYRFIAPLRLGALGTVVATFLFLDGLAGRLLWLAALHCQSVTRRRVAAALASA